MSTILSTILSRASVWIYMAPILLISFPVHESAHAYSAYRLGDPTAKRAGRLTLNPFKHLDLLGTICLVLFQFGWAKPVPVDPRNFKNPRAGMAATAVAGPFSNLILAFVSIIALRAFDIAAAYSIPAWLATILATFLMYLAVVNINLCLFNLIPVPPLDGSNILQFFLPRAAQEFFDRNARYFQFLILLLFFFPALTAPLQAMTENIYRNLDAIAGGLFGLFGR